MLKTNSFLLIVTLFISLHAGIPTGLLAQKQSVLPQLQFKGSERILFLGGSLFENELEQGYLEFAFTSRWPNLDLTFRNLGWTGDNVFAEARSTFTTPPTPYQQLFQQIRSTLPDYVFIAYGGVESQKGEAGIDQFVNGLEAIIDSVDALGAQTILLSTIPVKHAGNTAHTLLQNKDLKTYADAIASLASKRKKRYVDLYAPVAQNTGNLFLENGIHLNANGYLYLAHVLEQAFGWPPRASNVVMDLSNNTSSASGPAKIISRNGDNVVFSMEAPILPLPSNKSDKNTSISLQINGLKNGDFTLKENGKQLVTASAAAWAKGIVLDQGSAHQQASALCDLIVKKNKLFFQQYRPMNRTYILGFRSYEQGRHKQGLDDMNQLIISLEDQIKQLRKPGVKTYELTPSSTSGN